MSPRHNFGFRSGGQQDPPSGLTPEQLAEYYRQLMGLGQGVVPPVRFQAPGPTEAGMLRGEGESRADFFRRQKAYEEAQGVTQPPPQTEAELTGAFLPQAPQAPQGRDYMKTEGPWYSPATYLTAGEEARNVPSWVDMRYPRLTGMREGAAGVRDRFVGGALNVASGVAGATFNPEGPLGKVSGAIKGASEAVYDISDAREKEFADQFQSAINPEVTFDRPRGLTQGMITGGLVAEGSKYVVGAMPIRALGAKGIALAAKTPAGSYAQAALLSRFAKPATTVLGKVAQGAGQALLDVAAFLPVDVITTQRDIDSSAYMVEMLTNPENRAQWEADPESWYSENVAGNATAEWGANVLHRLAEPAVDSYIGRAKFEAATGLVADLVLRSGLGAAKVSVAGGRRAGQELLDPSGVGRSLEGLDLGLTDLPQGTGVPELPALQPDFPELGLGRPERLAGIGPEVRLNDSGQPIPVDPDQLGLRFPEGVEPAPGRALEGPTIEPEETGVKLVGPPERIPGEVDTSMEGRWYSRLQATLEGGPPEATGADWTARLYRQERTNPPAKRMLDPETYPLDDPRGHEFAPRPKDFADTEGEWVGIRGYLDSNRNKVLTKEDVLSFARENEIKFNEITKGVPDVHVGEGVASVRRALGDWPATPQLLEDADEILFAYEGGEITASMAREQLQDAGAPGDIADYLTGDAASEPAFAGQTQGRFGLEPESNYEETLVQLDRGRAAPEIDRTKMPPGYEHTIEPTPEGYEGPLGPTHYYKGDGVSSRVYESEPEARTAAWKQYDRYRAAGIVNDPGAYTGGHWGEPDVMGHIRKTDRPFTEVEGRAAKGVSYHVEELQADPLQDAREVGFESDRVALKAEADAIDKRLDELRELRRLGADPDAPEMRNLLDRRSEIVVSGKLRGEAIPDMPHKKTSEWVGLFVREALQKAVKGGHDRISWATGKQNADLNQQRRYVSRLTYNEATGTLEGWGLDGTRHKESGITPKRLPKEIGEAPAKRLMEQSLENTDREIQELLAVRDKAVSDYATEIERSIEEGTRGPSGLFDESDRSVIEAMRSDPDAYSEHGLDGYGYGVREAEELQALQARNRGGFRSIDRLPGEDLAIGGQGMIAFYDRIVPNAFMKELKKYGAVLEQVDVIPQKKPRIVEYEDIDHAMYDVEYGIDPDADITAGDVGPETLFKWVDAEGDDILKPVVSEWSIPRRRRRWFLNRADAEAWGRAQRFQGDPRFTEEAGERNLSIKITPRIREGIEGGTRLATPARLVGPATVGALGGAALPADTEEQRMANMVRGATLVGFGGAGVTNAWKLYQTPVRVALRDIDRAVATTAKGGTPEASVRAKVTALNNLAGDRFALQEQDLAELGVDVADPEAYAGFLRDQVQRQDQSPEAPRTPDIRGSYVRPEWMHASRDKLKQLALAGAARLRPDGQSARARFWYEDGKLALETLVPNDRFDQFTKFFATFSQNTDPRQNFFEALREWKNVELGLPVSGVLGGKKSKAAMALAGEELDTPKIWSFANNLLGNEDHPTIDLWMWRMLDDTTPAPKASVPGSKEGLRYAQAREELREIAAELTAETGDTWTPAQVQAATWVEYRDKWGQALGGKPLGNDSFLDLLDETIARVAALEPTMRVVGEMMPSPESRRLMAPQDVPGGIQGAPIDTRVRYAEARLKAARRILTKTFRDLGIAVELSGALGVQDPVSKAVRPAVKEGVKATIGGTWAGKWNTNVPFRLPGDIEPWKRDIVLAVMGDLFEQDALPWDLFRPNDLAALKKIENLRPGSALPEGVNGDVSGIRVVTREHLSPADGDALAAHLTSVLKDVNFTQDGDVLSFGEFSFSKTPKEFWTEVYKALDSFEGGRFFDELADKADLIYARFDGDLVGDTYGTGQWQDLYDKARATAAESSPTDPVRAAFPPDLLRTNRGKVRKKFASIDTRFRGELKRIQKETTAAGALEDPRLDGPALRAEVDPGTTLGLGLGGASPAMLAAGARVGGKAAVGGLVGGLLDASVGEDSPIEGVYMGMAATVAPSLVRRLKDLRVRAVVADDAIDSALQQTLAAEQIAREAPEMMEGVSTATPPPEGEVPPRTPAADKIDPEEFVNIKKFGLEPGSTEERLKEAVQEVVDQTGMDPKEVVTHEQTIRIAESLGLDAQDITRRLGGAGGAPAGADMLAARNIISANVRRIDELFQQLKANNIHIDSDEAAPYVAQINVLQGETNALLATYMPASSATGRALNAMKIAAQDSMDPVTWVIRAAKVSGVTELPPSIAAEITRLTNAKDKQGLMKLLANLQKSDISEQVVTLGKATMLSGLPTHAMNLLSTAYNVFGIEHLKDLPASWFDSLLSSWAGTERTKHWGSVAAQLGAAQKGAQQGIESARDVLHGRLPEGSLERWDQIRQTNIDLAQRTPLLKHVPVLPKVIDKSLDVFQKTVFGALGAGDALLTGFAVQRSLAEQARVIAMNEGLKGPELAARAAVILAEETTPEMMLEAVAQGMLATFRNQGIVGQGISGLKRGIRQTAKKTGGLVGAGDPAHTAAYMGTETLIPWSMTPANVVTRVAEASPLGAVSVAADSYFWRLLTRRVTTESPAAQKRIVERLGRSTVGAAPVLLGIYLYNEGLLSLGWMQSKAGQRELTGEEENAWKIGDDWVSMERMSPGGNLVILGGYIADEWQKARRDADTGVTADIGTTALGGGLSIARTAYEQSFLEGLRSFGETLASTERETGRENLFAGTASMFVPNILKRLNRWADPTMRVRETVGDQLLQGIPGGARLAGKPARVDPFGETRTYREGFYATMVDPFQLSRDKTIDSPVRAVMRDLDISISRRRKMDEETAQEYEQRQRMEGKSLEAAITSLIGSSQFLSVGRRAEAEMPPGTDAKTLELVTKAVQAEMIEGLITSERTKYTRSYREYLGRRQLTGAGR